MDLLGYKILDAANKAYPDDEEKKAAFIEGTQWLLNNMWINVTEGMPENYLNVLISAHGETTINYAHPIHDDSGNRIGSKFPCYGNDENTYWSYIPVLDK